MKKAKSGQLKFEGSGKPSRVSRNFGITTLNLYTLSNSPSGTLYARNPVRHLAAGSSSLQGLVSKLERVKSRDSGRLPLGVRLHALTCKGGGFAGLNTTGSLLILKHSAKAGTSQGQLSGVLGTPVSKAVRPKSTRFVI